MSLLLLCYIFIIYYHVEAQEILIKLSNEALTEKIFTESYIPMWNYLLQNGTKDAHSRIDVYKFEREQIHFVEFSYDEIIINLNYYTQSIQFQAINLQLFSKEFNFIASYGYDYDCDICQISCYGQGQIYINNWNISFNMNFQNTDKYNIDYLNLTNIEQVNVDDCKINMYVVKDSVNIEKDINDAGFKYNFDSCGCHTILNNNFVESKLVTEINYYFNNTFPYVIQDRLTDSMNRLYAKNNQLKIELSDNGTIYRNVLKVCYSNITISSDNALWIGAYLLNNNSINYNIINSSDERHEFTNSSNDNNNAILILVGLFLYMFFCCIGFFKRLFWVYRKHINCIDTSHDSDDSYSLLESNDN